MLKFKANRINKGKLHTDESKMIHKQNHIPKENIGNQPVLTHMTQTNAENISPINYFSNKQSIAASPIITHTAPFKAKLLAFQGTVDRNKKHVINPKPHKQKKHIKESHDHDIIHYNGYLQNNAEKRLNHIFLNSASRSNSLSSSVSSMTTSYVGSNSTYYSKFRKKNVNNISNASNINNGREKGSVSSTKVVVGNNVSGMRYPDVMKLNSHYSDHKNKIVYSTTSTQTDPVPKKFLFHKEKVGKPFYNMYNTKNDEKFKENSKHSPGYLSNSVYEENESNIVHENTSNDQYTNRLHEVTEVSNRFTSSSSNKETKQSSDRNEPISTEDMNLTKILYINNSPRRLPDTAILTNASKLDVVKRNKKIDFSRAIDVANRSDDSRFVESSENTFKPKEDKSKNSADVKFLISSYTVKSKTPVTQEEPKINYRSNTPIQKAHTSKNFKKQENKKYDIMSPKNTKVYDGSKTKISKSVFNENKSLNENKLKSEFKEKLSDTLTRQSKNMLNNKYAKSEYNSDGNDHERVNSTHDPVMSGKNKKFDFNSSNTVHSQQTLIASTLPLPIHTSATTDNQSLTSNEPKYRSLNENLDVHSVPSQKIPKPPPLPVVFKPRGPSKPNVKNNYTNSERGRHEIISNGHKEKGFNDPQRNLLMEEIRRARSDKDFHIVQTTDNENNDEISKRSDYQASSYSQMPNSNSHQSSDSHVNNKSPRKKQLSRKSANIGKLKPNKTDNRHKQTSSPEHVSLSRENGFQSKNIKSTLITSSVPPPDYD